MCTCFLLSETVLVDMVRADMVSTVSLSSTVTQTFLEKLELEIVKIDNRNAANTGKYEHKPKKENIRSFCGISIV